MAVAMGLYRYYYLTCYIELSSVVGNGNIYIYIYKAYTYIRSVQQWWSLNPKGSLIESFRAKGSQLQIRNLLSCR